MSKVAMPIDWNDVEGWEAYYASLYPRGAYRKHREIGSIPAGDLPAVVANLQEQGGQTVWIPGCGLSPLPKMLSLLGLDVHATDVSPTAVAYQQSAQNKVAPSAVQATGSKPGALCCEVHDFRQPYLENTFDLVINVKALQGFPLDTMREVAQSHYCALKPGRHAYFDTMNVQGEDRENLEASLVKAGFFLPFYELNRWYRQRLQATGIKHVFILGQPMVPMNDAYTADKAKWERDRDALRVIAAEYKQKAAEKQAEEQGRLTEEDRIATIIYSTG